MTIRNFVCRVCKGNNLLQEKRNLMLVIKVPHLMNMFMSPKNHEMLSFAGIIKRNKNKEMNFCIF